VGAPKSKESVFFIPSGKELKFTPGETVLEISEANRLGLAHSCGGMGSCGTCRVIVESDLARLPERTLIEQEMADDRGFQACERLACQLEAISGLRFRPVGDE
jgi:2Fe-2S ferredoxin